MASNHSVYREVIGRNRGSLVATPDDWRASLLAVLDNETMRMDTVQAAQKYMLANYSNSDFLDSFSGMLNAAGVTFSASQSAVT